ncbi:MAG: polyheme membrane-associated cytochrome C [Anaerolineae bacterium]
MTWPKIITFVVAIALIIGGAIWAYRIFEAPESIESITDKWSQSGHADTASESWTHWDEDEPPVVPEACAKCHSLYGYLDYLGVDGSTAQQVDATAQTGSVLYCNGCHNEPAHTLDSVIFPGDTEITGRGREANCWRCHQGRTSTSTVNGATAGIADDAVSEDLGFINVHYAIAAATRNGGDVNVGYQYEGQDYAGRYGHVADYDVCTECHDPHSTAINPDACAPCHSNVVNYGDLFDIRRSRTDYDGDGDTEEGILQEINAFHETLYQAIQAYASDEIGAPIIYADSFPYWFVDNNGNGEADDDEVNFGNQYSEWTPRLVRTTYTYHYIHEDPGAFTHNAEFVLQMLYDAITDLGEVVSVANEAFTRP